MARAEGKQFETWPDGPHVGPSHLWYRSQSDAPAVLVASDVQGVDTRIAAAAAIEEGGGKGYTWVGLLGADPGKPAKEVAAKFSV